MRLLGLKVEDLAAKYLKTKGLILIQRNFYSRFGEIDLIMQDSNTVCFIEVRHRKSSTYGSAAESITPAKQSKIQKTALFFIQQNTQFKDFNYRFDAVLSQGQKDSELEWIKNAF